MVSDEDVVVAEDDLDEGLDEARLAVLHEALHDPAAVLVLGKLNHVPLDLLDELGVDGLAFKPFDSDEHLLDHVVAVEVEGAVLDVPVVKQLLHHLLLLPNRKHVEAGLDHSAPVLVHAELINFTSEFLEDQVVVALLASSLQLDALNDVVAVLVHHEFVEVDLRISKNFIVESFLFVDINRQFQSILNESAALLVACALEGHVLDDVKSEVLGHVACLVFGLLLPFGLALLGLLRLLLINTKLRLMSLDPIPVREVLLLTRVVWRVGQVLPFELQQLMDLFKELACFTIWKPWRAIRFNLRNFSSRLKWSIMLRINQLKLCEGLLRKEIVHRWLVEGSERRALWFGFKTVLFLEVNRHNFLFLTNYKPLLDLHLRRSLLHTHHLWKHRLSSLVLMELRDRTCLFEHFGLLKLDLLSIHDIWSANLYPDLLELIK